MKLFLIDDKHNQIINSLDLGVINSAEKHKIQGVIDFLETEKILTRYHNCILAETCVSAWDTECQDYTGFIIDGIYTTN